MSTSRLGERLKAARLARNMTLADLARACSLTKGFISQVENGHSNPSLDTLRKIATVLEMPVSGLLAAADPYFHQIDTLGADTSPVVLYQANYPTAHAGIVPLFSHPDGSQAMVTLMPGTALGYEGYDVSREQNAEALITVLTGAVKLMQNGEAIELTRGAIAKWNAVRGYRIELSGLQPASLLIYMPQVAALPRLETAENTVPVETSVTALSGMRVYAGATLDRRPGVLVGNTEHSGVRELPKVTEGPLRLVAMRAQRLAERRRGS